MVTNRAQQEIIWIAPKKFQNCSGDWHRRCFWSAIRHFGTHFVDSFRTSKSSWMMDPTLSREMSSCSAIYLVEIRRFSKVSSWISSIISGMVSVLGLPGRGTLQVEKSPRLNWTTQFLTVTYDGAYCPNVSLRMTWISFGALPCKKKKLNDSSHFDVVEIAPVVWHASFLPL